MASMRYRLPLGTHVNAFSSARAALLMASVLAAAACGDDGTGSNGAGGIGGGGASSSSSGGGGSSSGGAGGGGGGAGGGGAGGGGGSAGGGSASIDCSKLPICDDFEGGSEGQAPDPAKWLVVYPDCGSAGSITVDGTQARSGTKSIKVTGGGNYCDHVFLKAVPAVNSIGNILFGRFFVRLAAPLDNGHTTFMAMKDDADGGKDLRMGGQNKVLMWNRSSDDATLPVLSPAGTAKSAALPANAWACVEFTIDQANGLMQTWVDGKEVEGLHLDATPTPEIDQQWHNKPNWKPSLQDWKLGWESYAGQSMTLWIDDAALAAERIGCD